MAAETQAWQTALYAISAVTLLFADAGDTERALELYALLMRDPYFGNSQYREDTVGKHIKAAAEALPSEAVAAAQERGTALDLGATVAKLLKELQAWQGDT